MKRSLEDSDDERETKRVKDSDMQVLQEMHEKLTQTGNEINAEMEAVKEKYYVSYFKKVLEKLPISNNIIDVSNIGDDHEGFIKTYTIAKTCVNAELQLKKIMAFNSIYDMLTGLAGKFVHDKYIVPNFDSFVSPDTLDRAYSAYQTQLAVQDDCSELHCISYLIQNEIDSKEPLKVPNPIFNRFTQQMTAVSKYVIEILKSVALQMKKPTPQGHSKLSEKI